MTKWKVPLADVRLGEDDIEATVAAYRSGWLSMGPRTERFEAALADYLGVEHALAAANGTAALHLACDALGLGPDDEVVVPSLTFVATVNAIAYTGASPVFADIAGVDAPWLSAVATEAAITDRTRAVMSMTYGGRAGETAALRRLCDARGIALLEDAAHGIGGSLDGRALGTLGAAGAYSFFSNKNLAVGEGGAVVTNNAELAERLRLLRSHGMTTLTWDRHRGHAADYDVVALGFNYRIDEPRAALAEARLARLDAERAKRDEHVEAYRDSLGGADGLTLLRPPEAGEVQAHHLFPIVLPESVDRDAFRQVLAQRGVQTSVHYPPVHRFSIYRDGAPELPLTDTYGGQAVTLPLFGHMTEAQRMLVTDSVHIALRDESVLSPA
jgi:dTDP-4-amino-4,6-dideoxygalactose transaminase